MPTWTTPISTTGTSSSHSNGPAREATDLSCLRESSEDTDNVLVVTRTLSRENEGKGRCEGGCEGMWNCEPGRAVEGMATRTATWTSPTSAYCCGGVN